MPACLLHLSHNSTQCRERRSLQTRRRDSHAAAPTVNQRPAPRRRFRPRLSRERRARRPSHLHPISQPAQPGWMQSQHFADFRALPFAAIARGKTLQFRRLFGLRRGKGVPGDLRAAPIEEINQGLKIVVHLNG